VSHANVALTRRHLLRLARLVVEQGRSIVYAARLFNVSWPTAERWADRFAALGPDGMEDRSIPGTTSIAIRCLITIVAHPSTEEQKPTR